jgi:hypothetical protein
MTSAACYHRCVRWVVLIFLAFGFAFGGAFRLADAAPQVEIRARTQLGIVKVKQIDAGSVEVVGFLKDKLTGQGIAGENVVLQIGTTRKLVMTGPDGGFNEIMPAAPGPVAVGLEYKGDDRLEKADPFTLTTDPSKAQVLLKIETGDHPSGARLDITATSEDRAATLPVALDITPVGGDSWKKIQTIQSGQSFILERSMAGGAGTFRLRAQFPGDATHQGALALATLELTSGSTTTMRLSSTQLAYEDDLVATGKVTDDDGKPLARSAVTLISGDRRLAQSTTNDKGDYRFEIEAEVIAAPNRNPGATAGGRISAETNPGGTAGSATPRNPEGAAQYGVQVQADPGVSYIRGSRSEPAVVRVLAPQPVPVWYTIVAFIATLGAAGGFFLARTKPWKKLRRAQRPAEVPSQEGEISDAYKGGLVVAKPGVVATLRRASDDGFSGVVRDTVRGRPVEGALVTLVLGDMERTTTTDAEGNFAVEKLETGEWRAEVVASGHVAERFGVSIPHRGELRGVRVDLVPVRERVFQLYRRAAEPVLPEARLWGIWSPRQIVDHVRGKRPSPALAELTDFVEEIYFSPRLAEPTVLPQAEDRVTRALNERARTPR